MQILSGIDKSFKEGSCLIIQENGEVAKIEVEKGQFFVTAKNIGKIPFETLFQKMTEGSKEQMSQELFKKILTVFSRDFRKFNFSARIRKAFKDDLCRDLRTKFEEAVLKIEKENNWQEKSTELIQTISDNNLIRLKNNLVESIKEVVDDELVDFRKEAITKIRDPFIKNGSENSFGQCLGRVIPLPNGTKFFIANEEETILVIEQPPQVRTVTFSSKFMGLAGKKILGGQKSFQLAFPYIIFVMKFFGNRLQNLYLFYATEKLTLIDKQLYYPNLTNIASNNHVVCLGNVEFSGNITEQAEKIISYFWQSEFNGDLSELYRVQKWSNLKFLSLKTWQRESRKNPLFVLNTEFIKTKHTIKSFIEGMRKRNLEDEKDYFDGLTEKFIEEKKEEIGKAVREYLEEIEIEQQYSKAVGRRVEACFENTMNEICDHLTASLEKNTDCSNKKVVKEFNQIVVSQVGKVLKEKFEKITAATPLQPEISAQQLVNREIRRR